MYLLLEFVLLKGWYHISPISQQNIYNEST